MAESTVEVIVANPARKRHHRPMAHRRMTLKQRLHFGSARQRAAAKSALKANRSRKRNAARKSVSRTHHRKRRRTQNPGEIIAMTLGNPARKKGRKKMAATHRKRRHASRHNAGHRRRRRTVVAHRKRRSNPARRHTRRRTMNRGRRRVYNPAGYRWSDLFVLGGGALVGSTLSSAGTQMILGTSNTGAMGYAGNLIATLILSWLGGMVTRNRAFPAGILAGGIGGIMRRIIADYSLLGGYTAQLGMGDYMVSNWVTPQRLASDFRSLTEANVGAGGWGWSGSGASLPVSSSGVSTRGMGLEGDSAGSVGY